MTLCAGGAVLALEQLHAVVHDVHGGRLWPHSCNFCALTGMNFAYAPLMNSTALQGVLYSHRSNFLQSFTMSMADACGLTAAASVLAIVPMFHANSWALAFGAPMFGSKLVLPGTKCSDP